MLFVAVHLQLGVGGLGRVLVRGAAVVELVAQAGALDVVGVAAGCGHRVSFAFMRLPPLRVAQPSACPPRRDVCPAVSVYGRGRTRCHLCSPSRGPSAAAHLRQTICTASAAPPVAGCASLHEIPPKRRSWLRLNASPQTVWLVPGSQPCTSPAGRRCPSGSRHSSVAATRVRTALTPRAPPKLRTCSNRCPRGGAATPTPGSAPAVTTPSARPRKGSAGTRSGMPARGGSGRAVAHGRRR